MAIMENTVMESKMRRHRVRLVLGITGILLLIAIVAAAAYQDKRQEKKPAKREKVGQEALEFQTEEIVYDGSGRLDLLEGVRGTDVDGSDITREVNALITGSGTRNRKKVRYSLFTAEGRELTRERTLVLKNYQGPKITLDGQLNLEASWLDDLIEILKEKGKIKGDDGFGKDVTNQITWTRKKLSQGSYLLTFQLSNAYLDTAQETAKAQIEGEVSDLVLTLVQDHIEIPVGADFDPLVYVEEARDPLSGSVIDRLQVSSSVNVSVPGRYSVVYTAVSLDGTQTAEAVLSVTVTGGGDK